MVFGGQCPKHCTEAVPGSKYLSSIISPLVLLIASSASRGRILSGVSRRARTFSRLSWDHEGLSSVLLKHVTSRGQLVALGERFMTLAVACTPGSKLRGSRTDLDMASFEMGQQPVVYWTNLLEFFCFCFSCLFV